MPDVCFAMQKKMASHDKTQPGPERRPDALIIYAVCPQGYNRELAQRSGPDVP